MAKKYLYKNKWVSLIEIDGDYVASEETRTPSGIIVFLGFVKTPSGLKVLVRHEYTPAWRMDTNREKTYSGFTGGIEGDEDPDEAVFREAAEEAGIDGPDVEWHHLGTTQAGKSCTALYHLYACVLPSEESFKASTEGDGSQAEAEAANELMDFSEAIDKLVDPMALAIIARSLKIESIWE